MFDRAFNSAIVAHLRRRRHAPAHRRSHRIGDVMSSRFAAPSPLVQRRPSGRIVATLVTVLASVLLGVVSLVAGSTTAALACACGCSVFDVGGLNMPQEQDHGGEIFFEYWTMNQNQTWVGSSSAPASVNSDKDLKTSWYNVGFQYMFNRQWGVMMRVPIVDRTFTTETDMPALGDVGTFHAQGVGDIEVMGMYTGFFPDMSTGLLLGLKLPTGPDSSPGLDRDTQIGSGSTDLLVGGFHRGMLSGDNAWQYFAQARWQEPFLYSSVADPQGFFDGNAGVVQLYKPGYQVDGAIGIDYNNWYHVLGFDKITPLAQAIISHRAADSGPAADPLNSGFDRIMLSPGIEFTKVLDEANNRVLKTYFDIEVPVYYRTNAANNAGTEGQLVAPYMIKLVTSYHF